MACRMRWLSCLALLACTPHGATAEPTLAADLQALCARVASRQISAWSQPVYRTPALGPLTARVDTGDAAARCELGRLMRRHAHRACGQIARGLTEAC